MEIIISKIIRFEEFPQKVEVIEYPEFQKYMDEGYVVKSIHQELLSGKDKTSGLLITVVLYKAS
ncbi:hypothetical protein [Parabacteroides distasonis]|uniref:hypothetical protein n=1 Tax=Parabacteroides distasonis TaxID=823 RepID=UPI0032195AA9